jgi:hypothetical protein
MDNKDLYKWYIDRKICPCCKKRKITTNHKKCPRCLYNDKIYKIKKRGKKIK